MTTLITMEFQNTFLRIEPFMTIPPNQEKPKNSQRPFVREQIGGADRGCIRGILVFIGLFMLFGLILFVMSQV